MSLAAWRGSEVEASALIEAIIKDVRLRGEGIEITVAEWSNAVLNNGLGHYQKALPAAQRATENYDRELVFPNRGLVELIPGRRPVRVTRTRDRSHAAAFAVHQYQRQRLGARGRSALTGAAEPGRGCRSPMRGVPSPIAVTFSGCWRAWREGDGPAMVLAGAAPGYGGDRIRPVTGGAVRGSRRAVGLASEGRGESCRPATARPPGEPRPPTAGHPGRSFPQNARARPRCSRPGRQARRAGGAPLMIVKKILTASVWRPSDHPCAGLAAATRGSRIAPRWCGWCCRRRFPTRRRQHG